MYRIIVLISLFAMQSDSRYEERRLMVDTQIVNRGIRDKEVIRAMLKVERHRFVPAYYSAQAYDDNPLPIGYSQTISQPYIVAFMTEAVNPKKGDKILEIGTGSGYQAAVLAEIVDHVYTVEIVEPLGLRANHILNELVYKNISVKIGDGYNGWQEHAPFDGIVVTAAPDYIPSPLFQQLKEGGKMVIPVGKASSIQELLIIEKRNGKMVKKRVMSVRFVPFTREKERNLNVNCGITPFILSRY